MDPLPADDLRSLDDARLRRLIDQLERRKPPAAIQSAGVRPDRSPWTYREIGRLEAARAEMARRRSG
jgi:hypothetical protein